MVPSSWTATMGRWMRALRFTVFLALVAGLLSAAGYLWAPLVAPEVPPIQLAAPPVKAAVVIPLRIPPVDLRLPPLPVVPPHLGGSVRVPRLRLVPQPAPVAVAPKVVAPKIVAPTPVVVHHPAAPTV